MATNLVFGNYVTSATFCLKLGKTEIAALAHVAAASNVRDGTEAAFWSLQSKGLIAADERRMLSLTEAGRNTVSMLHIAGLIADAAPVLQAAE